MNQATEVLLRRAVSQAVSLTRTNARCVFTDKRHEAVSDASTAAAVPSMSLGDTVKTLMDLPGPNGYPVVGSALEYFKKPNRGQMHEVQVSVYVLIVWVWVCLATKNRQENCRQVVTML